MAFSKARLMVFGLACAFFLSSSQVHCNENEDTLLKAINTYRNSFNLSALAKHDKAACLADEIADGLEDRSCSDAAEFSTARDTTGAVAKLVNFPDALEKCGIDANTTASGAILPTCVPKMIENLVVGNYTSNYAKYLNDSRFTGAGVGSEDDWIVVVLTTDKPAGKFTGPDAENLAAARGLPALAMALGFLASLLL